MAQKVTKYSDSDFSSSSRYEHFFGPLATHNLCVTNAMKVDLQKNWGIKYDLFCTYHVINITQRSEGSLAACRGCYVLHNFTEQCESDDLKKQPRDIY